MPNHIVDHHYIKPQKTIDRAMDVVAVASPLMGIPQVIQVFSTQDASGLSLASWVAFMAIATIILLYAITHKIRPLIIAQSLWLAVYAAIIPGIVIYS